MDKKPDFGDDLSELSSDVSREVSDVLNAVKQRRASKMNATKTIELDRAEEDNAASSETVAESSSEPTSNRRSSRTERRERRSTSDRDTILENVTTRLSRTTNELLTEATLRQRLKKTVPATRQDIIEEALGDWLKRHGYRRE